MGWVFDKESEQWHSLITYEDSTPMYGVCFDGNDWGVWFTPIDVIGGYLSTNLRIECGFGIVSAIGLKPSCCFATKEDAMAIAERHHKTIVLA
jgi:hypothetical protein